MPLPFQSRIPRRQAFLLLIAILVPCLVLVLLAWQMMEIEERSEENRRAEDQRSRVQQELQSLLKELQLEVKTRIVAGSGRAEAQPLHEAVAFTGVLVDGRLSLPWEDRPEAPRSGELLREADFARAIHKGEVEETRRQYESAAEHYRGVIEAARHPVQRGYAQLGLARSLEKSGRRREGILEFERVLGLSPDLVDEFGVPMGLYAATPLIGAGVRQKEIFELIRLTADRERRAPPFALSVARVLAQKLEDPEVENLVDRAVGDSETAQELQGDSATLARLETSPDIWISYGEAPWLVAYTPAAGSLQPLVIAVRADQVLAHVDSTQPIRLAGKEDSGVSLGDTFPGLRVILPAPDRGGTSFKQVLLAFAVILALAFALLAGYFVQRDVQRSLRVSELRSQFVSSVTHELKTPLTAIRMFSETLRLDEEVDRQTRCEYLDTILHESERLSRLVDNVLDFGNIERGKRTYRFKPVHLDGIVEEAARTIQYPLEQAGFTLDVAIERDLPTVAADSDALEQAILNLLTNAMKYSGDSRQIGLTLFRENGHARIHVADRGIGISRVDQARIFDRFYRVTAVENQHIPGAGLGLTLAAHIVKAHGGDLNVESSVGVGSTFTIQLPLREKTSAERLETRV